MFCLIGGRGDGAHDQLDFWTHCVKLVFTDHMRDFAYFSCQLYKTLNFPPSCRPRIIILGPALLRAFARFQIFINIASSRIESDSHYSNAKELKAHGAEGIVRS